MIGKLLTSVGKAVFPIVGPIHDVLGGKDTPVSSEAIKGWEGDENYDLCGRSVYFYTGGTIIVGALLGLLLCKFLPMKKKRTSTRRRRKATTTRRRRTYRKK